MKRILVLLLFCSAISAFGQRLLPKAEFLKDSLLIGEAVPIALTIKYPVDMEMVFPDSNYNYEPFEFVRKEFFASQLDSTIITDSVVYYLSSFEIDPVQYLSLPVFLITNNDSTGITSNIDSIYLIELVPVLSDSLSLKEDVAFVDVNTDFNYPYLFIGVGILVILIIVVYFAFGDQIRKKIRLYRLEKAYKRFTDEFDLLFADLRKGSNIKASENLLLVWKSYMEGLENRPYTKLTSKEIGALSDAGSLTAALKDIDRGIYGGSAIDQLFKSFEALEDITSERYNKKVWEVKHG